MKPCFRCGRTLPLEAFYRHPQMADGHLGKCKDCTRRDVRLNRLEKRESYLEYDRLRYWSTPKRWRGKKPPEIRVPHTLPWKLRHPEKRKAHVVLGNALRSGRVVRMACEVCGCSRAEGHHDDYSLPLAVRWLCKKHHIEHHMKLGA